ncbi:DUF5960 family protein [Streptococcus salivarius]|jgi:hypothetical protein|uniref:DUF5960 family protein n=1 Tax=Streptococcus salivarius TaxID=1304 RepID=UPI001EFB5F39|nr:DUF5960 family protein [Streptococcus salivarius]
MRKRKIYDDKLQIDYFLLNKENARDGCNHYFHFEVSLVDSRTLVRQYRYLGND